LWQRYRELRFDIEAVPEENGEEDEPRYVTTYAQLRLKQLENGEDSLTDLICQFPNSCYTVKEQAQLMQKELRWKKLRKNMPKLPPDMLCQIIENKLSEKKESELLERLEKELEEEEDLFLTPFEETQDQSKRRSNKNKRKKEKRKAKKGGAVPDFAIRT